MPRRFPNDIWLKASDEAFDSVPQTCPAIQEEFAKTIRAINERCDLDPRQERIVRGLLGRLRYVVRTRATEPLRTGMTYAIAQRMDPEYEGEE